MVLLLFLSLISTSNNGKGEIECYVSSRDEDWLWNGGDVALRITRTVTCTENGKVISETVHVSTIAISEIFD